MNLDKFSDPGLAKGLLGRIESLVRGDVALMEVCGTHTMAIASSGIRNLLPKTLKLLSGPGCPVCVTPTHEVDRAVAFSKLPDVILTTFGDMLRVTGSESSLEQAKAEGAEVRVVYSPRDALSLAREHPDKHIIFVGVGFETTSPTIAATVKEAREKGIINFFVQPAFKLVPEALRAILEMGRVKLAGFLCPGHVSTIIGSRPYEFIPRDYGKPCVIAGFEPVDILEAVAMLLEQIRSGKPRVEIQYRRTVRPEGNPQAVALMEEVFEPCDSEWRAIGLIPKTGLAFRKEYQAFDATKRFPVTLPVPVDPPGCLCGEVMMGIHAPRDCSLFGGGCTPAHPVGPCMVSSEGACAAWYKYGER